MMLHRQEDLMVRLTKIALIGSLALLASSAWSQTNVGADHYGGLPWSVAAPQGAEWTLSCSFTPVTLEMSIYDRKHWANRLNRTGRGPQRGRLPGDNGSCTLTKTNGSGAVAIALVKDGVAKSAATLHRKKPVTVNVF